VDITYVFACLAIRDRDRSLKWYGRLLGRPPTFIPNDVEAVWHMASTASLHILVDAERAGQSITTLVVQDLDASLSGIAERGIAVGPIEVIAGAGRKSLITDPDGNRISIIEILTGAGGASD
jgi:predicted enzyme related to lactoylglutathione lyase